jgi:hypothetical protein
MALDGLQYVAKLHPCFQPSEETFGSFQALIGHNGLGQSRVEVFDYLCNLSAQFRYTKLYLLFDPL